MIRSVGTFIQVVAIFVLMTTPCLTHADTWGPALREHPSADGKWALVRDLHGNKTLSLCEKTDEGYKEVWRRNYVDRVWPPHRAYVTNDGKYVVLRDVYHNLGYGKVIVILGEEGKILGSYELSDFLPQNEFWNARRSVSSIWWNTSAWFSFLDSDQKFVLVTQWGTIGCFDLASGELLALDDDRMIGTLPTIREQAELWQASDATEIRVRGLLCQANLGDAKMIPTATALLKHSDTLAEERVASAMALTRMIRLDAIPIIESTLPQVDTPTRSKLLDVLTQLDQSFLEIAQSEDSPALKSMWVRLTGHPLADVRDRAILEALERDDGTFLIQHPELIEHALIGVRSRAIRGWGDIDSPQSITMLRTAINDRDPGVRLLALRRLVDRNPDDTQRLLRRFLEAEDSHRPTKNYVVERLAVREDPDGISALREMIATWPSFDHKANNMWADLFEIERFCKLIADLKLESVRDSLNEARSSNDLWALVYIHGALAALGDEQALKSLHDSAENGQTSQRVTAIEMCRYLSDAESQRIVQEAASASHRNIRDAATKKLDRFK